MTACPEAVNEGRLACLLGLDTYQGIMLNEIISGADVDELTEITLPNPDEDYDANALKNLFMQFGNMV